MFLFTLYFFSLLPSEAHVPFLFFCLTLGAGIWVTSHWGGLTASSGNRVVSTLVALALAVGGGWVAYTPRYAAPSVAGQTARVTSEGLEWDAFKTGKLNTWLASGET